MHECVAIFPFSTPKTFPFHTGAFLAHFKQFPFYQPNQSPFITDKVVNTGRANNPLCALILEDFLSNMFSYFSPKQTKASHMHTACITVHHVNSFYPFNTLFRYSTNFLRILPTSFLFYSFLPYQALPHKKNSPMLLHRPVFFMDGNLFNLSLFCLQH